jgi:hypothetical protein
MTWNGHVMSVRLVATLLYLGIIGITEYQDFEDISWDRLS